MELLNRTGVALTICLSLLLIPLAGRAGAAVVYGASDLEDGNIYIPLSEARSGVLGDHTADGSIIGLDAGKVKLTTQYPTASGYVELMVDFDISGELLPGEFIGYDSEMSMWINFDDLDFKPVLSRTLDYREWVDIVLLNDIGERVADADIFTLDAANYLTYRQDLDAGGQLAVETNNVPATYGEMSIRDVFFGGNTEAWEDFVDSVNEAHESGEGNEFGMLLTFNSALEMTRGSRLSLANSIEQLDSSQILIENIAPEPGTLTMLALGGLATLARRKKRQ